MTRKWMAVTSIWVVGYLWLCYLCYLAVIEFIVGDLHAVWLLALSFGVAANTYLTLEHMPADESPLKGIVDRWVVDGVLRG